jgi:hypothetical protein
MSPRVRCATLGWGVKRLRRYAKVRVDTTTSEITVELRCFGLASLPFRDEANVNSVFISPTDQFPFGGTMMILAKP